MYRVIVNKIRMGCIKAPSGFWPNLYHNTRISEALEKAGIEVYGCICGPPLIGREMARAELEILEKQLGFPITEEEILPRCF